VQRPHNTINKHFAGTANILKPSDTLYPGIEMVFELGKKIAIIKRVIAVIDTVIIWVLVLTLPLIKELEKRPTSISIQYIAAIAPPIAAPFSKPTPPSVADFDK
jgi:hypothetical protein